MDMEVEEQPATDGSQELPASDMEEDPPEGVVTAISDLPVAPPPLGCGLDSCFCLTLLDAIHPQGVLRDFPYLRGVNEDDLPPLTCRLQRQYEEFVEEFQQITTQTLCLLQQKQVEPQALVAYLEKVEATRHPSDQEVRRQPLYQHLVGMLRGAGSLEGVLEVASIHYSAFCYHVLTNILQDHGDSPSSKFSVHRYMQRFNLYNQRPIALSPKIYTTPRRHGYAFVLIHLDWDPMKRTLHELEALRLTASTVFKLTHYPLMYIAMEMRGGVMVQVYQVPGTVRDLVLPLDESQRSALETKSVLKVECCGQTEMTKLGEEQYETLLHKVIDYPTSPMEDVDFVTPPSSPPPSLKALPTVGTEKDYILDPTEAGLTSHHFELTRPGFEGKSYIAYVSDPADNSKLMAMLLSNHVSHVTGPRNFVKVVILVNSFRRAQQVTDELVRLLPEADIKGTTGADKIQIATEVNITMTTITVVTTGKLLIAIQDGKTSFKPITLLMIDGCEQAHHETSLEDLMHLFMDAKRKEKLGKTSAQIVGLTNCPSSGIFALSEEAMMNHLIGLCGLTEADSGIHVTSQVRSEVFQSLEKEPRLSIEVSTIYLRWRRQDVAAMLCVEMEKIEGEVGVVYSEERWNDHYMEFVKEKRSTVSLDNPDRERLLALYDLLPIYCRAVEICKRQEPENVGPYLKENRPNLINQADPMVNAVLKSYDRICEEYNDIIKYEVPLETDVARALVKIFSENNEWRGFLFLDAGKETQAMVDEISSTVHHARPAVLSGKYISISKLNKKKRDIEVIEAFKREDTRLIVSPFELENFDDISLIDLPTCNFILRLQKQSNEKTKITTEGEYVLTFVSCEERKTFIALCQCLQTTLLEKALSNMPKEVEFKSRLDEEQKKAIREYTNRGYRIRRAVLRRKPQVKKAPYLHQITLRCKKCRVYACHGNQLYTLFIDGCRNYVVPDDEFRQRFSVKKFRPVRKVPKQISRLQKMHCNNCNREWGHMCFFPKRGITLPVLRAKNFYFEIRNNLHKVKMWPDATFYVPALGACLKYFGEDSDPE